MQIRFNGIKYYIKCDYSQKDAVKEKGFKWDSEKKLWWTDSDEKASYFFNYAEEPLKTKLQEVFNNVKESIQRSRATNSDIIFPVPDGLEYLGFQKGTFEYSLTHHNLLIGDEMGLGKTIQGIGLINLNQYKKILVVCPATLKKNWQRELNKWLVNKQSSHVVSTKTGYNHDSEINIINPDILKKFSSEIHSHEYDLIIVDEFQQFKNLESQRSQELFGKKIKLGKGEKSNNSEYEINPVKAKRKVFMSGTPIPNRVIELFPIVSYLWPDDEYFGNFFKFAYKFCAANKNSGYFDCSGASNLEELQIRLRSMGMIRRLKKEVMKDLPGKVRQNLYVDIENKQLIEDSERFWDEYGEQLIGMVDSDDETYIKRGKFPFEEMARLRKETGIAKIPSMIEMIEAALENNDKVLFFAHHQEVLDAIENRFKESTNSIRIDGSVDVNKRQGLVDKFQNDKTCRLGILSIKTSVGTTFTAANWGIFGEITWVPSDLSQAEDRMNRIGQTETCFYQYIFIEGTIDDRLAEKIQIKQKTADAALDNVTKAIEAVEVELKPIEVAPPKEYKPKERAEGEVWFTQEERDLTLSLLKILASFDYDRARDLNGMGFNKNHSDFGNQLASQGYLSHKQTLYGIKLCNFYRKQLPTESVDKLKAACKERGFSLGKNK